jgi:hypothetical protein
MRGMILLLLSVSILNGAPAVKDIQKTLPNGQTIFLPNHNTSLTSVESSSTTEIVNETSNFPHDAYAKEIAGGRIVLIPVKRPKVKIDKPFVEKKEKSKTSVRPNGNVAIPAEDVTVENTRLLVNTKNVKPATHISQKNGQVWLTSEKKHVHNTDIKEKYVYEPPKHKHIVDAPLLEFKNKEHEHEVYFRPKPHEHETYVRSSNTNIGINVVMMASTTDLLEEEQDKDIVLNSFVEIVAN